MCARESGFNPGRRPEKTIRPEGRQNVGLRNQLPNIIWGTDDLPPLQGEFMMLDLPGVKTPGRIQKDAKSVRYGDRLRATRCLIRGRGVLMPGGNDRIRRTYSLDLNDRRWDSVISHLS
jgi:hypothetical protein